MKKLRIIPRLDVKGPNVVKGIQLEGLRVIGNPAELAYKYCCDGADEILYIDIVASLYERNNLVDVIKETISKGVFVPLTVGGGIRSIDDIQQILRVGADKVAINTAATRNPNLILEAARKFGSSTIVGSIEAKKIADGKWEAYIDNGRERTGLDVIEWAKELVRLGVGEILLTSVDRDGVRKGYDKELIKKVIEVVDVPVIVSGGAGSVEDIEETLKETDCNSIAVGSILHYNITTINDIKNKLIEAGLNIRNNPEKINDYPKSNSKISIIDYGLGNLKSVIQACYKIGCEVELIDSADGIKNASHLILPGVGAFGEGMQGLRERNLVEPILTHINSGKPMLGICLGAQLMLTESEEFGVNKGLNIINGKVRKFKNPILNLENNNKIKNYYVPHIGWNNLIIPDNRTNNFWENTILEDYSTDYDVYFVHSYYLDPEDKKVILANTEYGNQKFCSIFKKGNVYGSQFHPEKSGDLGLKMLSHFSKIQVS